MRNENFSRRSLRHPKGHKQARINNVRRGSIPPHAWDDILNKKLEHQIVSYLRRFWVKNMNYSIFRLKVKNKFPNLSEDRIKNLYYSEKDYESWRKDHQRLKKKIT